MLLHYLTLGLNEDAGDEEIRDRYLSLVKRHTPEKDPEKFRRINEAYEAIKSRRRRIISRLFEGPPSGDGAESLRRIVAASDVKRRRVGLQELFAAERRRTG